MVVIKAPAYSGLPRNETAMITGIPKPGFYNIMVIKNARHIQNVPHYHLRLD